MQRDITVRKNPPSALLDCSICGTTGHRGRRCGPLDFGSDGPCSARSMAPHQWIASLVILNRCRSFMEMRCWSVHDSLGLCIQLLQLSSTFARLNFSKSSMRRETKPSSILHVKDIYLEAQLLDSHLTNYMRAVSQRIRCLGTLTSPYHRGDASGCRWSSGKPRMLERTWPNNLRFILTLEMNCISAQMTDHIRSLRTAV